MRKLSIIVTSSLLASVLIAGCGDSDDSPGKPDETGGTSTGGTSTGGRGGTSNSGGTSNHSGSSNGGSETQGGEPAGGTGADGGSGAQGGEGPGVSCTDVYADRPMGVKDIPADEDGNITVDTLTSDTIWTLNGRLFVKEGEELTIEPCTLIEATGKPNAGSLFVERGAKIHAVGTPDAPIVFTTQSHEFEQTAPWGGVVLLGSAPIGPSADDTTERVFEGLTDPRATYGGTAADDSSGELAYVRIEFGGDIIVDTKEINGLTLGGVGNGTELHHIMVKDQQDDCFEWFGGTVNAHHLICQNSGDDMFDTDEGFKGHLQYLFGRNLVEGSSKDPNGLEWDGNQPKPDAPEATRGKPMASNVTICGLNQAGTNVSRGAVLRRGLTSGTSILNALVTGWDNGVDTRDAVGTTEAPLISWTHSYFFGQLVNDVAPAEAGATDNDAGFDEVAWISADANANVIGTAPEGFDCYADVPVPPTTVIEGAAPAAPFDEAGAFVGAFGSTNWATGSWVNWE